MLQCEDCGKIDKDVTETECPYQKEINDIECPATLCSACYQERLYEI